MFAIFNGPGDLIIILLIVLLLFGGAKIPELARGLGKGIREFNKAKNGDYDEGGDKKKPAAPTTDQPTKVEPAKPTDKPSASGPNT
jgi:sec-independent protein translocase protein TatA